MIATRTTALNDDEKLPPFDSKALGDTAMTRPMTAARATTATRYIPTKPISERWTTVKILSPSSSMSLSADLDKPLIDGCEAGAGWGAGLSGCMIQTY